LDNKVLDITEARFNSEDQGFVLNYEGNRTSVRGFTVRIYSWENLVAGFENVYRNNCTKHINMCSGQAIERFHC